MTSIKRLLLVSAATAAIVAFAARPAAAFAFDLNLGNSAISGFTGPYANVNVQLTDSTHATITFTGLSAGGNMFLLGDGGSVAVNVNATSWTLGTVTGSNAGTGFVPGPYSDGGSGNEDGWGSFNQTINSFDGYGHSSDTISFVLTNTSGTWATDTAVLTGNGPDGYLAAAHIFVTTLPANAGNNGGNAIATGYATGDGTNTTESVPDGGMTVSLLGLALGGLGLVNRRKK